MNIYKLFANDNTLENKTLLLQGFQRTDYNNSNISLDTLLKEFINLFIETDTQNSKGLYKVNTQNGTVKQIQEKVSKTEESKQKTRSQNEKIITFGSDLKIILNNIVGIVGYEFGTNIVIISLYPHILKQNIESLLETNTYKEMLSKLNIIKNMYSIGDGSVIVYNVNNSENNITYDFDNVECINKEFQKLTSIIELRLQNCNNVNFDNDKQNIYKEMLRIYDNTKYNTYYLKNVDNLCIELGKYKPCYDGYFVKLWELLFKQTYSDYYEYENVYPKFINNLDDDKIKIDIPFMHMIEKHITILDKGYSLINQINKQISILDQYFRYISKSALTSICNEKNIISICIDESFYEHLSTIIINMLYVLSKNIVISHNYINSINKSVKLQFMEIFQSLRLTTPTLLNYTESQLNVLHYIMMTKSTLEQMVIEDTEKQTKKRKKKTNNE